MTDRERKPKRPGVQSERVVDVSPHNEIAGGAAGIQGGAGQSAATGAAGSGSVTDVPGGLPQNESNTGTVGGTHFTGIGGPTPSGSATEDARVRGAGAKDARTEAGERDTRSAEGGRLADQTRTPNP